MGSAGAVCRPVRHRVVTGAVQATYEKLQAEVPKYKMITASVLSDRLRVRRLQPARGRTAAVLCGSA